jgi:phosphoglycolate phosphatase
VVRPVRLIVFDCDGTLVDSQALIVDCMRGAFLADGLEPPEPEAIRRIVGLSLVQAIHRLLGEADLEVAVGLAERYRSVFMERRLKGDYDEPMFPGARTVLNTLSTQRMPMGVATGKTMRGLRHVLATHGIEHHFVTLQTADLHPSKPHPAMLEAAMRDVGVSPQETLLVGDTTFDIEMAKAAGAVPIGVAWGNHPADELQHAGAAVVLDAFERLLGLDGVAGGQGQPA